MPFEPKIKLEHSDSRGQIYSISLPDDQELMLLHSKKGSLRGGHSHDCDEVVVLLSGRMRYAKMVGTSMANLVEVLEPGDASRNFPGEPHMGEFLEDSWLIEYKLGTRIGEWRNTDYEPQRALVRESL